MVDKLIELADGLKYRVCRGDAPPLSSGAAAYWYWPAVTAEAACLLSNRSLPLDRPGLDEAPVREMTPPGLYRGLGDLYAVSDRLGVGDGQSQAPALGGWIARTFS